MVKLDLPKATSAADIQKPEKVEFAIDANGGLFWKGERITREEAIARFAEEGAKRPQPEVYLRADQNVPYRYVAETLADASKGGLSKVAFVSEPARYALQPGAAEARPRRHRQLVAVGIGEVEAAAAGEVVGRFDDAPARRLDAALDVRKVVGVEDDQRTAGAARPCRRRRSRPSAGRRGTRSSPGRNP